MLTRTKVILNSVWIALAFLMPSCATTAIERGPDGFRYFSQKDVRAGYLELQRVGADGSREIIRAKDVGGDASSVNAGWQQLFGELVARLPVPAIPGTIAPANAFQRTTTNTAGPDATRTGPAVAPLDGPDFGQSIISDARFFSSREPDHAPWKIDDPTRAAVVVGENGVALSDLLDSKYDFALQPSALYAVVVTIDYDAAPVGVPLPVGSPVLALQDIKAHHEQGGIDCPLIVLYSGVGNTASIAVPAILTGAQLNSRGFGVSMRASMFTDAPARVALRVTVTANQLR